MREIRALGGGNVLLARSEGRCRAGRSKRAEDIYRARHALPDGGVRATFEIVYLSGWGPDRASRSRSSRAAPRSASPMRSAPTSTAGDKAPYPHRRRDTRRLAAPPAEIAQSDLERRSAGGMS